MSNIDNYLDKTKLNTLLTLAIQNIFYNFSHPISIAFGVFLYIPLFRNKVVLIFFTKTNELSFKNFVRPIKYKA